MAGLASKANQSALDALQLEVGKSTPASVDARLASYGTTAAMNSAITSANNATLAAVGSTYALRTITDQLALANQMWTTDLNAAVGLRTSPADIHQKVATAPAQSQSRGLPRTASRDLDAESPELSPFALLGGGPWPSLLGQQLTMLHLTTMPPF